MPEKEQLAAIRHWLLDHHEEFRKLLAEAGGRKAFTEFEGNALTRPPKGFPAEHPAMDLVRCRQWGMSVTLPAEAALDPKLAQTVIKSFQAGGAGRGCAEHADRGGAEAEEEGAVRAALKDGIGRS